MRKEAKEILEKRYDEMTIDDLLDHRQALKAQIDPIEEQLDVLNGVVKQKMPTAGRFEGDVLVYEFGEWIAKMSTQVRKSLDRAKLLVAGVTVQQLTEATVETTSVRLDVERKKEA